MGSFTSLVASIERNVEQRPDAIALRENEHSVSYRELWARASQLGRELGWDGRAPGVVLLCDRATVQWFVVFLAATRGGHLVAVLDAQLPPEIVAKVAGALEPTGILQNGALTASKHALPATLAGTSARFMYFTSGSTGVPKGVVYAEEAFVAQATTTAGWFSLCHDDVSAFYLPIASGMNLLFVLSVLVTGGSLVLEPNGLSHLQATLERIDRCGVTVLHNVPTSLRAIVERGALRRWPLAKLRLVRVGAGVLTCDLAERTLTTFPHAKLIASYGLSEFGVVGCRVLNDRPITQGVFDTLFPGLQIEILEDGEIELDHAHLFLGYFDVERASFHPRRGPHRTGDTGEWADGVLTLGPRKKAFAKVGGVLISLDRICNVALESGELLDAAAIATEHAVLGEEIHLFCVPNEAAVEPGLAKRISERVLTACQLRSLPRVHVVPALPKTEMGKLRRAAMEALLKP